VFRDDDDKYYMYFGGIWGGQLQSYRDNEYNVEYKEPLPVETALGPRVARLSEDLKEFAETVREITILDEMEIPCLQVIMTGDFLKRHGCISIRAGIIFHTQQVIPIIYVMQLAKIPMDHLFIVGEF
jgi:hypothetical protein